MSSPCLIPSNPDVAGIGVRIAIYVQNILCFVPAVWAIWDGQVTEYELASVETQSTTNLVLAFAILISCIVQAFTLGLTNYHASIVLSMSWINNTSVFVYFLMYVHQKANGREPVKLWWSSWLSHFMSKFRAVLHSVQHIIKEARRWINGKCAHTEQAQQEFAETPGIAAKRTPRNDEEAARTGNAQQDSAGEKGRVVKIIFQRVALLFGSLHLTLMAALGLWLWSKPQAFGKTDSTCSTEFASLAILGSHVPFGSNALRIFSLVFYSVFLLPGFNLLIPMLVFISVFICHDKYLRNLNREVPVRLSTNSRHRIWLHRALLWLLRKLLNSRTNATKSLSSSAFPVWVGLGFLLAINVVFIADIELTLHRNLDLQASGEAEWGFGQVLAILLLFMPLRDLVEMIVSQKQKVMATHELMGAIPLNDMYRIHALVKAGANPNVKAGDNRTALEVVALTGHWFFLDALIDARVELEAKFSDGRTALEAVSLAGNKDALRALINARVDLEAKFSDGRTAIEVVCTTGHNACVEALIKAGVNCQTTFTDGHTALEVVALAGCMECLKALIKALVDLEAKFPDGRTALEVACTAGQEDCVRALIDAGVNCQAEFTDGHTVLEAVVKAKWWSCLRALIDTRVDLEAKFPDGRTALEVACTAGQEDCVRALIDAGVNCQATFTDGRTALEAVVNAGWWCNLFRLRRAGVNLEAQFSDGLTALEVVTVAGDESCLKELLEAGVNIETKFSDGRTALEVASSLGHERCVGLLNHVAAGNPASQWEIPRSILLGWRPPQYLP